MNSNEKKHNGVIAIWKFVFSIMIILFHSFVFYNGKNPFYSGGYIAVEFFFVVSGYFFARSVLKEEYDSKTIGKETFSFIVKKIKSFLPYILIAYFFSLFYILRFNFVAKDAVNSIWNLLLLREFGFRTPNVAGQLWYLTAMLTSMFILYPLLKKYKENWILIASPLIITFGLGYLNHNWLGLNHSYIIWNGFIYTGMIRGFCEINIGLLIYYFSEKLKKLELSKFKRILLTILGEGLLISVILITNFATNSKNYDYVMLLFISIAVLTITSELTYEHKIIKNGTFKYLEKISLPMFINHVFIISYVSKFNIKFFNLAPYHLSFTVIVVTIIFSMIEVFAIDKIKNKFKKV